MSENKEFEHTNCPICNEDKGEHLASIGMFGLPANFNLCRNCGFGYLNPRLTKKGYNDFYTNEYDKYYRHEAGGVNNDFYKYNGIKEIVARLEALYLLPKDVHNILDIGSGEGWFLDHLKKKVFPKAKCYAIEPSPTCVAVLKSLDIEYIGDDVDTDWHLPYQGKFDLIIMRHVLEHFLDPVDVLKKVSHILSDKGILYIGVPSMDNPSRPVSADFIRNVHTNYFTKVSLENALYMSGLAPLYSINNSPTNPHELYSISRKTDAIIPPFISTSEFDRSKKIITDFLTEEGQSDFKMKYFFQKRKLKYTKKIKKLLGIKTPVL